MTLLKQLYARSQMKLSGELEARFQPIRPGQGPFSGPAPSSATVSQGPGTASQQGSGPSGQEGASQQPPKSSSKSRDRSALRDRGSAQSRDRSNSRDRGSAKSCDRSTSRDREATKPATVPKLKGTFAQAVKQPAHAPVQKIVIAAPKSGGSKRPLATMVTCPPPRRPLEEDVKDYGPEFRTIRVPGSTGQQPQASQHYRTKEVVRHRILVCQDNLAMSCDDLPPDLPSVERPMETDTPGPVPIAIGIGPGIPAAAGQSAVATGSTVRPAASAGTPSSEDEREIYVPAPQGHGFTGSTQGAEETDHAWHMGRRIPMVRPGLRIQGLIEVPGPALISITTLTEGVVEGSPRVQVPTTFTIYTDQAFMVPGRVTALPPFPWHRREAEDLLRNMAGIHVPTPGDGSASGSMPPPPPPPSAGPSGGQGPPEGGPNQSAGTHLPAPIPDLMSSALGPNGSHLPAAMEAQAYSPTGLVAGAPNPSLVDLEMGCENQPSSTQEGMEQDVVEIVEDSDFDSAASVDSHLVRDTKEVVLSPPVPELSSGRRRSPRWRVTSLRRVLALTVGLVPLAKSVKTARRQRRRTGSILRRARSMSSAAMLLRMTARLLSLQKPRLKS